MGLCFAEVSPLYILCSYRYELILIRKDVNAMLSTWFRTLSFAFIAKVLTDSETNSVR